MARGASRNLGCVVGSNAAYKLCLFKLKPTDQSSGDVRRWWWDFINLIITGYVYRDMINRKESDELKEEPVFYVWP